MSEKPTQAELDTDQETAGFAPDELRYRYEDKVGGKHNAETEFKLTAARNDQIIDTPFKFLDTRAILYNDTIHGKVCGRDDMWAITTAEIENMEERFKKARSIIIELAMAWENGSATAHARAQKLAQSILDNGMDDVLKAYRQVRKQSNP